MQQCHRTPASHVHERTAHPQAEVWRAAIARERTVEIVENLESRRWSSNARRAGPVIGVLSGGEGKYKVSE